MKTSTMTNDRRGRGCTKRENGRTIKKKQMSTNNTKDKSENCNLFGRLAKKPIVLCLTLSATSQDKAEFMITGHGHTITHSTTKTPVPPRFFYTADPQGNPHCHANLAWEVNSIRQDNMQSVPHNTNSLCGTCNKRNDLFCFNQEEYGFQCDGFTCQRSRATRMNSRNSTRPSSASSAFLHNMISQCDNPSMTVQNSHAVAKFGKCFRNDCLVFAGLFENKGNKQRYSQSLYYCTNHRQDRVANAVRKPQTKNLANNIFTTMTTPTQMQDLAHLLNRVKILFEVEERHVARSPLSLSTTTQQTRKRASTNKGLHCRKQRTKDTQWSTLRTYSRV